MIGIRKSLPKAVGLQKQVRIFIFKIKSYFFLQSENVFMLYCKKNDEYIEVKKN